jgi:hypothetical protein
MTTPTENFDELLDRVRAGRLDDLTTEQVAALEAHLNGTPAAAGRLADVMPVPDPRLTAAAPLPSAADWDNVWERIDSGKARRLPARHALGRVFRLWQPLAAAAACLLLLVVWRTMLSPAEPPWQLRLSDEVVVHELEVSGDASAFVAYADDGSGTAVIWVFEEDESEQGA